MVTPAKPGTATATSQLISADGDTLVTFDVATIYIFTRTSGSFSSTPSQTLQPSGLFSIGVGLSLSADGALLACGATDLGGHAEV